MNLSSIIKPLLAWFAENARVLPWREQVTPYRVWVSEIMLQQTRVEAVKAYFLRFMEALPEIADLAACDEEQLLKLWEGLGYYSRVKNMQKAARIVMAKYAGQLPRTYEQLLELPGIGPYTAGSISSIAFGEPNPAVDGNVLRVISRITASRADISAPKTKVKMTADLSGVIPHDNPGAFNQSLMELGATVCKPNGPPECMQCPVKPLCQGYAQGIAQTLPVKSPKKARKVEPRTILLLMRDEKIAVRKRPATGILAGLWEFPSLEGYPDDADLVAAVRQMGLEPLHMAGLMDAKHIFTHVEWHMKGMRITVEDIPAQNDADLVWVSPAQLLESYAVPSAFRPYVSYLREQHGL